MAKEAAIIKNLTVKYPYTLEPAVKNISFTVKKGKILALIGPNGSGKSTIVKAILGLIPFSGKVDLLNRPLKKAYHEVGYLPQNFHFDRQFPLTVSELLRLALVGCTDKECQKNPQKGIEDILKEVESSHLAKLPLAELSGGQLQRVMLARALIHHPKLLILDEPEAGVDVKGEHTIYELIKEVVNKHQVAAILVTHDLDFVKQYADEVLVLNQETLALGPVKTVLTKNITRKLYGHE